MSLYGRDFIRQAHNLLKVEDNNDDNKENDDEVDVQFQENGYLFLSSSMAGKEQLQQNNQQEE